MIILGMLLLSVLLYFEYRSYNTCITPFFVIGVIYFFSIPIVNVIGNKLGYYKINNLTILLFVFFLTIVFASDFIFKLAAFKSKEENQIYGYSLFIKHQKVIWYTFLVFLTGYALSFFQAMNFYGIANIKGKSNGLFGHMGLVCIAISPFIVSQLLFLKKIKYFIGLVFLYLIMLLFGGKTYIFISIVASCVFLYDNKKIKLKTLVKLGGILATMAFLVFVVVYTIIPCLNAGITEWSVIKSYFKESIQHLFYYYAAPFLCSNEYFSLPMADGFFEGMRIMFAPFITLYEFLLGDKQYPYIIMEHWAPIADVAHRTTSNVGGLFSESVFHIGYLGTIFYVFGISLYSNILYYIKRNTKYYHASSSLAIALLGLCFFCNYFTLLVTLEIIVYLFLFESFLMLLDKKRIYFIDWRFRKTWKTIKL